jgi:hypothetical protein
MMSHRQLIMDEPRLFEEFRLKDSPPERVREISVVESAYDSVLCADFTYVSTPITSGAILYAALEEAGLSTLEELRLDKDRFYNQVILPNIKAAESVASAMLNLGGAVIAPAVFEAKALSWGQDEYMGLWLDTIERKATRIAMVDGWEYSNGGCEEYLQALLMQAGRRDRNNIQIADARGEPISHLKALQLILAAIDNLTNLSFTPTTLARVFHRCILVHAMVANESDYGICTDRCGKTSFTVSQHYNQALDERYMMIHGLRELRNSFTRFDHLLTDQDRSITSSLAISPDLLRQSEREDLAKQPVKIICSE